MGVAHGCGCAPDDVVRWIVVGLLSFAGTAILILQAWRRRHTPPEPPAPTEASRPRDPAAQSAPVVAGLLILALSLFVALVSLSSDPALLVLALGATIGTAGFALGSPRLRRV